MKTESTKDILTELTVHITRVSGDIEHIKTNIDSINNHLEIMNGRIRENEKQISWMKGIGATLIFAVSSILTWLGVEK